MAAALKPYLEKFERLQAVLLEKTEKSMVGPWLKMAEERTGIQRKHILTGLFGIIGIYLVFGYGAQLLCNTIGFAYPAVYSIRAIESKQKDDDTKWLTYWVVYATFAVVEFFSDLLVSWFPFYWLVKCIFQIWCFFPSEQNGSLFIYRKIIKPYYLKNQNIIDEIVDKIDSKLMKTESELKKIGKIAEGIASSTASDVLGKKSS